MAIKNRKTARSNQAQMKLSLNEPATKELVDGYGVMQQGKEWVITHDGKPVDTVFAQFKKREDAEAEIEYDRMLRAKHEAAMRKEAAATPKRFKVHFDVYPDYWCVDRVDGGRVGHYTIEAEYHDKKPTDKELQARMKQLKVDSAEVWDAEMPEVMAHHMPSCGKMLCPANKPGSGLSNEGTKFFHLLTRLPKEEAHHLVSMHEIGLGHKFNKRNKAKLHDDGLPLKRACIACGKQFDRGKAYGKVCCSFECYADAAARKLDWMAEYSPTPAPKAAPKGKRKPQSPGKKYLLRDNVGRVWTGISWSPEQHGGAKIFTNDADIETERHRMIKGQEFTVEEFCSKKFNCTICGDEYWGSRVWGPYCSGVCAEKASTPTLKQKPSKKAAKPESKRETLLCDLCFEPISKKKHITFEQGHKRHQDCHDNDPRPTMECERCGDHVSSGDPLCKQCAAVIELETEKAKLKPEPGENEKECPNCKVVGDIDELFGWRMVPRKDGMKRVPQSRCHKCR